MEPKVGIKLEPEKGIKIEKPKNISVSSDSDAPMIVMVLAALLIIGTVVFLGAEYLGITIPVPSFLKFV